MSVVSLQRQEEAEALKRQAEQAKVGTSTRGGVGKLGDCLCMWCQKYGEVWCQQHGEVWCQKHGRCVFQPSATSLTAAMMCEKEGRAPTLGWSLGQQG